MNKQHVPVPSTLLTRSSEEKTGQHINKIVPIPGARDAEPHTQPNPAEQGAQDHQARGHTGLPACAWC